MKKSIVILLIACLCVFLCACGKSEEAVKSDELILAIGEISADKVDIILEAQACYEGLTEKQKEQVENYNVLVSAIEKLPELIQENDYNEALAYFEQGDYANALVILSDLGEFKDAEKIAEKCELYLSPIFVFADYIKNEGSFLPDYQETGITKSYGDATITVYDEEDTIRIIYEIGEPCFDWKNASFEALINYMESMDWLQTKLFEVGDDQYNHAKVGLSINKETGWTTSSVEYIVFNKSSASITQTLCMASLRTGFDCADYQFDSEFESVKVSLGGFLETDMRGNQLISTALGGVSMLLNDSNLGYSLRDIGWEYVG